MLADQFRIDGEVCVITGGGGTLGIEHARAVLSGGGIPVLLDISEQMLSNGKSKLNQEFPEREVITFVCDITQKTQVSAICAKLMNTFGHVDILINNAANNPKMEQASKNFGNIRFDNFPLDMWADDLAVGLTGALLCTQVFGKVMENARRGVILNISSDLGIIAPDQRIYRKDGLKEAEQPVKPVTYSVIKHGLIGLTKYLATYWAEQGIRVNALCPAGVENGQPPEFVEKLTNLVPMRRMAQKDEYQATVLYMISKASSYMTGSTIIVDGGRTCW